MAQLQRLAVLHSRLQLARNRDDTRKWVQDRRARTRQLIELGGLVHKAGLVELVDDDRATLLGAFLELANQLRQQEEEHHGDSSGDLRTRWRRRGLRAFEANRQDTAASVASKQEGQAEEESQARNTQP